MCLKAIKEFFAELMEEPYKSHKEYSGDREITLLTPITKITIPSGCSVTLSGGEITIKIEAKE